MKLKSKYWFSPTYEFKDIDLSHFDSVIDAFARASRRKGSVGETHRSD